MGENENFGKELPNPWTDYLDDHPNLLCRTKFFFAEFIDSAAGGTFMSITLGAATKLLDDMMINYSEWHTERAPQGKKVNSVEETSSLSDKIDVIMSMLVNGRSNVDPNNVPLASLVAQEENVDVNFIKNNNFNNNAYRNNSGNNYRPYPSANGNGYGNSYGNSYNNNRSVPSGLEAMLKEFISTQTAFNKSVEEKLDKIDTIASRVDRLASDVNLLKLKVMPNNDIDNKITTTANAIQVRINENIRLMAELRARWDREENEKLAKKNNVAKVWTITTTSNAKSSHVAAPPTINGKIIGVGNVSTPSAKRTKLPEIAKTAETACDKTAEIFSNLGNNDPIAVAHNDLDFDDCHISEVIKFLQKLAKSPNASAINLAFTKHITNALIKAREEKLKLETSIPRKLEDGWEPIIKMKFNDFECNALCDLGASISVMPKKIYDMLDLPPLKNCYLDVNLADNVKKKHLGRIDNVHITVNNNLVPVDFVVLDIECNASCPIVLGRPFLRTVGAIIDMREAVTRCCGDDGGVDGGDDDDDDDDGDDVQLDDDAMMASISSREGISPADSRPPESSFLSGVPAEAAVTLPAEEARASPVKRSTSGFAEEDDLFDMDEGFVEPPSKKAKSGAAPPDVAASEASSPKTVPAAQVSTASSLSKEESFDCHRDSSFCVISSLEAFASQFTSLEADKVRLQKEVKSSSSKLDDAVKMAAAACQEVDSLKEELGKLKEKLKEEEASRLAAEARAAEKDDLLRQSSLALLEAADIPVAALDKIPNNSPANGVSMTLATHQLTRELLEKGKGAMTRMHLMIFPKLSQNKTLGQLIDAFAVNTKEVIEVFKHTSRTYGALLAFQLMMGHGFKADIEKMSKELPKDQDGQFIDLGIFKTSAVQCARQLLDLVSSEKTPAGPSLSSQTQAP
ncbi:hypothetical protein QYE76_065756 [Lolium multiflorum]|uniref:Uncharacterized protein n=1 Tax=Lolium multiflorum TaxID=4521 RepID=A0AAD8SAP7_LOLMU|nr:hypothetical protein QYE76_065756 [Lolium multiflorum]